MTGGPDTHLDLPGGVELDAWEREAHARLSTMARDYYAGGAGSERTLADNLAAFDRWAFRPRVLVDVGTRDLGTRLLGGALPHPVLVAPTAFHGLAHGDGEVATAFGAAAADAVFVASTLSNRSLEDIAGASRGGPGPWFQLYVHRDRGLTRSLVERAEQAGFRALCLTVDAPRVAHRPRDARNRFHLPPDLGLGNLDATGPLGAQAEDGSGLLAYFAEQIDPTLGSADLDWLRSITTLPIVVKGVLRGDDARRCVDHGADAVWVSNHGGRQLDGAIASLDALPEVVAAVGDLADVIVDGGVRRGRDAVVALALGAHAVAVGRPALWGLSVAGSRGVTAVLSALVRDLDETLTLLGVPRVTQLGPDVLARRGEAWTLPHSSTTR